jgi:arylformamidase
MDAPIHFVRDGEGMDRMPLDATIGRTRVIEIQDPVSIKPGELGPHGIGRGERILFKT